MPEYQGSIRVGDGSGENLATQLTVDDERLIVAAGDHEIGNWAIEELSAERRNGTFHIGVEGEELVLTVADPVGFMQALGIEDRPVKAGKPKKKKKEKKVRKARSRKDESPRAEPPPDPVPIPAGTAAASPFEDQPPAEPSWWSRVPLRAKQAGAGVLVLVILGVFLPDILALLLLLAGMVTLFLGIAARSDGGTTILPPAFFGTTAAAVLGIALVLVAVLIIAVT